MEAPWLDEMSSVQREAEAALLYEQRIAERGPRWDQIGESTRGVWLGYINAGQLADLGEAHA